MDISELKVLICDDSLLARKNLRDGLKGLGCKNIIEVFDGQGAIDTYLTEKPDVVFLDIVMPVKDGITATREIRALERRDAFTVPIVAMSANAFDEDKLKSKDIGMNDHIIKPLEIEHLTEVLQLTRQTSPMRFSVLSLQAQIMTVTATDILMQMR